MSAITLLFPHQLFEDNPVIESNRDVYLVEEVLFFNQYNFHKQKLAFHRASMRFYAHHLQSKDIEVKYIEASERMADVRHLLPELKEQGITAIHHLDTADDWLRQRLNQAADEAEIVLHDYDSPLFLNPLDDMRTYFDQQDSYHHADFYVDQRKTHNVLLTDDEKPIGGKWSFDPDNRSKYPKDKTPPALQFPRENEYHEEAKTYVENHFSKNYGTLHDTIRYPVTYEQTRHWLDDFLHHRFQSFGDYQDAIVRNEHFLNHSVLTPMLNVGLITPKQILDRALDYAESHDIPLNALEGFVRQILGWREYIRAVYELEGRYERTANFWDFNRSIPSSFWDGSTGIPPVDDVIRRVLDTGYAHHIERLMVLGNFMLLCEFDPDEVYQWFMELFVDAYDWVMVPNVYGMSQFADGGLMATKPYISSSNYIRKMSNFGKGDWQPVWDGLFWRFMHVHRNYFEENNRMKMLLGTLDRMNDETRQTHLQNAHTFLEKL
jgi:deoxyribodipyrimidine photolyase-related protein